MDSERADSGEELLTLQTPVVLLTGVCLHMGSQRRLDCEGAETLAALVGLLVRVDPDVAHQVTRLLKLLRAVCALVPPYSVNLVGD